MIIKVQGILIGKSTLLDDNRTQFLPHQRVEPSATSLEPTSHPNLPYIERDKSS